MAYLDYEGLQHYKDTENEQVAPVESSNTSANAYEIGKYFWYEGNYCKAKTPIAVGDAFVQNTNFTVVKIGDEIEKKANVDGLYESMTVGNAEQLVSTIGVEDKTPYNFRTSGGSIDIGDRETDMVVGGTIAWNQIGINGNFENSNGWAGRYSTVSVANNIATVTPSSDGTLRGLQGQSSLKVDIFANHKYILCVSVLCPISSYIALSFGGGGNVVSYQSSVANTWTRIGEVWSHTEGTNAAPYVLVSSSLTTSQPVQFKDFVAFDLTQMFGSTIADYVYSLEQTTSGAGVAWFKSLFPKPYYDYNAGELLSVNTSAHNMTGFNQWDEQWETGAYSSTTGEKIDLTGFVRSKNMIPCFPSTTYYFNMPDTFQILCYDASKTFFYAYSSVNPSLTPSGKRQTLPENCYYITFYIGGNYGSTYKNDVCINLSWDGERNGEYEPYVEYNYPLDSSLELRGIPKLDSANNLYYDGDTYESDGTVTRRYGMVDLSTLPWTYDTSGANPRYVSAGIKDYILKSSNALLISSRFILDSAPISYSNKDRTIYPWSNGSIYIMDYSYTDATTFAAAMSGVYLVYELAEPTTEEAEPYQNPQIVNDFGTEEYVDYAESQGTRDVKVPVGHDTVYAPNLRAKLETTPDSPQSDGDYIVRHQNGENQYTQLIIPREVPDTPVEDGTYSLVCTVSSGTATLSWASAT